MRRKTLFSLIIIALFFSSCLVVSVNKWHSDEMINTDINLSGKWVNQEENVFLVFKLLSNNKSYKLKYSENTETGLFKAWLIKIGNDLYVEFTPYKKNGGMEKYFLINGYSIMKAEISEDTLKLYASDKDKVIERLKKENIQYFQNDDNTVLTMDTEKLVKFVSDNKDIIFSKEPGVFVKEEDNKKGILNVIVKSDKIAPPGKNFYKWSSAKISFLIENNSDDFIIVRDAYIKDQLQSTQSWYGSRYGSVTYKAIEDEWEYNEMNQTLTQPVFTNGLILPHKNIEISSWVLLRNKTMDIHISYQRLTSEQAQQKLYFGVRDNNGYSFNRIFKHIHDFTKKENYGNLAEIIFPDADKINISGADFKCSMDLKEKDIPVKDKDIIDAALWIDNKSFAVKTKDSTYLSDGKNKTILPDMDLTIITYIVSQGKKISTILPMKGYEKFNSVKPHIEGPGYFNPGVTVISKNDILDLLKYAKDKNDRVSVLKYDPNGLGSNLYLLIGEFNIKERQKFK